MNIELNSITYEFNKLTWKQALRIFPLVKKVVKTCIANPETSDDALMELIQAESLFLIANLATVNGKALTDDEVKTLIPVLELDLSFEQGFDICQNFFTTNFTILQKVIQLVAATSQKPELPTKKDI